MNENLFDLEEAIRLLREANRLLREANRYIESTHGDDCDLYYKIQDFLNQFN